MAQPAQGYSSAAHTRSIADLIQRDGEIRAATTQRAGQIAGDAWSRVGDTVGSFLSDLGRESRDAPERLRQQEAAKQRDAIAKENADAAKAERDRVNAAREKEGSIQAQVSMYRSKAMKQNQDGTWSLDLSNMRQQMEQAGLGDRMDQLQAQYSALEKDTVQLDVLKKQRAALEDTAFAKLGRMVLSAGATPDAFAAGVAHFTQNGLLSDDQVKQYVARVEKDPEAVKQIATVLAGMDGTKPVEGPKAGSLESIIASRERERGRPLTADEMLQERTAFEKAGWKPERPAAGDKPDALTLASRATIERDKEDRLIKAQDRADAALKEAEAEMGKARGSDQAAALARFRTKKDAIYARLGSDQAQIQKSYRQQMGASDVAPAPARTEQPAPQQPTLYLPDLASPSASMGPRVTAAPPAGPVRPTAAPAAPAAPAGPVTPKRVVSRAQIEAVAKKNGITYEEAKRRAEQTFNLVVR